jgi:hypothetical protein
LYLIREYMPEDSARHVDWKATAKSGSLKVREFSREDERKLRIVFDNPEAGAISEAAYERGVNLAASLAWHFSAGEAELSFAITGTALCTDVHEFLARLAVIGPYSGNGAVRDDLAKDLAVQDGSEYHIIITARPRGSVPTGLWDRSYMVFLE